MSFTFGSPEGTSGRDTKDSVEVAKVTDHLGRVAAVQTYGGMQTVSDSGFLDGTRSNEATNGQTSVAGGDGVVTEHSDSSSNEGFTRFTKTTMVPPATT